MRGVLGLIGTIMMSLLLVGPIAAGTPVASPVPDPSCNDLEAYRDEIIFGTYKTLPDRDQNIIDDYMTDKVDPTTERPGRLRQASAALDRWADALEKIDLDDVPSAAHDYHELFTRNIGIAASMTNAVANGGPFAMFAYGDVAEELPEQWDQVHDEGRRRCGDLWHVME